MPVATHSEPRVPWLLLLFSLPAKRATQRVEIWRQLQRSGAVALHHSTYLLPGGAGNEERFEWLATMIRDSGGEASVASVASIDGLSRGQLIARFREARARDYRGLLAELRRAVAARPRRKAAAVARLRARFEELAGIDFFRSPLQSGVRAELERAVASAGGAGVASAEQHDRRAYRRRVWATRPRPGIDRSASAWLIRRFIDPAARFVFAPETRLPRGAVPFDMFHGGFGHRGNDCTFEVLQKVFGIRDAKVARIAEIVHDADLTDQKFGRREGYGIDEVLKGWAREGWSDREILEQGMRMVEGLYRSFG